MSTAPSMIRVRVTPEHEGKRLDYFVAMTAAVSRRVARIFIASGRVLVNNQVMRILSRQVRAGAVVQVFCDDATEDPAREPLAPALRVLHLDRYIVVIDKPAGLLSEGDRDNRPTVEALAPISLTALGERREHARVWIVHRLDASTSGVMILARTPMAARTLGEAFRQGEVHKTYLALCCGRLEGRHTVDGPIARAERTRHVVSKRGKPAQTALESLAVSNDASLVRAAPKTGRTHQIRVHLAHLGHPLLGDALYGGPRYLRDATPAIPIKRPMLHAHTLGCAHPKTRAPLCFTAEIARDFQDLTDHLGLALPTSPERP